VQNPYHSSLRGRNGDYPKHQAGQFGKEWVSLPFSIPSLWLNLFNKMSPSSQLKVLSPEDQAKAMHLVDDDAEVLDVDYIALEDMEDPPNEAKIATARNAALVRELAGPLPDESVPWPDDDTTEYNFLQWETQPLNLPGVPSASWPHKDHVPQIQPRQEREEPARVVEVRILQGRGALWANGGRPKTGWRRQHRRWQWRHSGHRNTNLPRPP
jgi:hypothetical protein